MTELESTAAPTAAPQAPAIAIPAPDQGGAWGAGVIAPQDLPVPNLTKGIAFGLVGAMVGALIWMAVAAATGMEIGYIALAIGAFAGLGVRKGGKPGQDDFTFRAAGGAIALFGVVVGQLLSILAIAHGEGADIGVVQAITILPEVLSPMDLLFYGIGVYEGFKFAGPS